MASNYIQEGETLDLIAPSGGVVSGDGYVIGGIFVVALNTAAQTLAFRGKRTGVFELDKATGESGKDFAAGETVFWDNTNKVGDKTNAAFYPIGVAVEAAASTAGKIKVLLSGIPTAVVGA